MCGHHPGLLHRHRPVAWQDVAGRPVCDAECAEKEAVRQAADASPRVHMHSEIDGLWGLSLRQVHVGPRADMDDMLDAIAEEDLS
jgi:hypothetical protein